MVAVSKAAAAGGAVAALVIVDGAPASTCADGIFPREPRAESVHAAKIEVEAFDALQMRVFSYVNIEGSIVAATIEGDDYSTSKRTRKKTNVCVRRVVVHVTPLLDCSFLPAAKDVFNQLSQPHLIVKGID